MTPEQEQRLRKIEERANAATPGPWVLTTDVPGLFCPEVYQDRGEDVGLHICDLDPDTGRANARLMVHSRDDIPWLIAQYREADAHLQGKGGET